MMEDCFICNHLTYRRDCCTFYRIWNENVIEKCKDCINKNCGICYNKETTILQDGKWIPYCDICIMKSEVKNNMNKEWINDGTIYCNTCGTISKSYFLNEEETNFCPSCGSGNVECKEDEE